MVRVDVYPDGPKAEIKFLDGLPNPSQGRVGAEVVFKVRGVKDKVGKIKFMIGELEAEIVSIKDSLVTVKIPQDAITGGASIHYDNQMFFGPEFRVRGNLNIDQSFIAYTGANGTLYDIVKTANGYLVAGAFTDFNNMSTPTSPINDLVAINQDGTVLTDNNKKTVTPAGTKGGAIFSIEEMSNSSFMIGGMFTSYNKRSGINGLTRVNVAGRLDTSVVALINLDPENTPQDDYDTVATFNGGVNGIILKTFETYDNAIITVGNFTQYNSYYYERSTKSAKVMNRVFVNQLIRLNSDGSLDSTFNYNTTLHRGNPSGNGGIAGAVRLPDDKILLVGGFTTFNGQSANRLVCINETDGAVNTSFNTGSGADDYISTATYNEVTDRILVTGNFRNFNGIPANGVVMLRTDGSVDQSFTFLATTSGKANYAGQLNNGRVIVSGAFTSYGGKIRPGFALLNADGTLAEGYNNTGAFVGQINKIVETTTALGNPGVILVGNFTRFDNIAVKNIVHLEMQP